MLLRSHVLISEHTCEGSRAKLMSSQGRTPKGRNLSWWRPGLTHLPTVCTTGLSSRLNRCVPRDAAQCGVVEFWNLGIWTVGEWQTAMHLSWVVLVAIVRMPFWISGTFLDRSGKNTFICYSGTSSKLSVVCLNMHLGMLESVQIVWKAVALLSTELPRIWCGRFWMHAVAILC